MGSNGATIILKIHIANLNLLGIKGIIVISKYWLTVCDRLQYLQDETTTKEKKAVVENVVTVTMLLLFEFHFCPTLIQHEELKSLYFSIEASMVENESCSTCHCRRLKTYNNICTVIP